VSYLACARFRDRKSQWPAAGDELLSIDSLPGWAAMWESRWFEDLFFGMDSHEIDSLFTSFGCRLIHSPDGHR